MLVRAATFLLIFMMVIGIWGRGRAAGRARRIARARRIMDKVRLPGARPRDDL
ncbi:hypothetical protein [Halodurantibacterium flavum]|uniref:Uncharacterized protein n=1 Tax=Halodurantibacterium flavum TaxID=1382802 RepID=A0ABW4S5J4_9RHOB